MYAILNVIVLQIKCWSLMLYPQTVGPQLTGINIHKFRCLTVPWCTVCHPIQMTGVVWLQHNSGFMSSALNVLQYQFNKWWFYIHHYN
jgi:hypothetical protein